MNDTTIKLRVGTEELEVWRLAAKESKLSLSAWVRKQCQLGCIGVGLTEKALEILVENIPFTQQWDTRYSQETKCEHKKSHGEVCYKCDPKFGYPNVSGQ
jgi:hypothetical protein